MPCLTLHQRRVSIFVGLGERAVEDVVELCAQSPERVFASRPPGSLNQPSYQLRGEGGLLRRQNVAVGGVATGLAGVRGGMGDDVLFKRRQHLRFCDFVLYEVCHNLEHAEPDRS